MGRLLNEARSFLLLANVPYAWEHNFRQRLN